MMGENLCIFTTLSFPDSCMILVNDEGYLLNLPYNWSINGFPIVGDAFIVKVKGENMIDLSEEEAVGIVRRIK